MENSPSQHGLTAFPIKEIESKVTKHQQVLVELLYSSGLLRKKDSTAMTNMPIAVNPKLISRAEYAELQANSLAFHRVIEQLYDRFEQLVDLYESYSHDDDLVQILLRIYRQAEAQGRDPLKPQCLIIRNDFMFDSGSKTFQQVEFNTMSVGLGQQTTNLYKLSTLFHKSFLGTNLPFVPNSNSKKQIKTLSRIHATYGNPGAVFLEVMLPDEPNIFDSIPNERLLCEKGIPLVRLRLNEITPDNYRLDEKSKKLYVFNKEVAVVYLRSLYDPSHFNDQREAFWVAAERSRAVVVPSVISFLIGIKLTQHLFTSDALLNKFDLMNIKSNSFSKHFCDTKYIETNFANDKQQLLEYLQTHRDTAILKSYKEGGMGMLLGGEEMLDYAEKASLHDLQQLLVAHKIDTPVYESLTIVDHELMHVTESISEVSIYSSFIMTKQEDGSWKAVWEAVWDYLLRSKYHSELKGGINIGASFMDTLIFDD